MSKATENQLSELHGVLARVLKEQMELTDEDGRVNAAVLNQVRQFLKDNNITSTLDSKPMKDLVESLPSFEDEPSFHPRTTQH